MSEVKVNAISPRSGTDISFADNVVLRPEMKGLRRICQRYRLQQVAAHRT